MKSYTDGLTGLNNMTFLYDYYSEYLKQYKNNCYLIAIDFAKLKYINDNFGHAVGDLCLKTFSNIIQKFFPKSLLIRRSGDEFVIVTSKSTIEIEQTLTRINDEIAKLHDSEAIPILFQFNCGIKICENNLDETLYKADITMYDAKEHGFCYSYYNDEIYSKARDNEDFIANIDRIIKEESYNYECHNLYDKNNNKTNLRMINITDKNGKRLYNHEQYELIKNSSRIKRIDLFNIKSILEILREENNTNTVTFIPVDYKTIVAIEYDFIEMFKNYLIDNNIDVRGICLNINFMSTSEDIRLIDAKIRELKGLGIKICIDNFDPYRNSCIYNILKTIDIDYVKFYPKSIMNFRENPREKLILFNIIDTFVSLGTTPIFHGITDQEIVKEIKDICLNCLVTNAKL